MENPAASISQTDSVFLDASSLTGFQTLDEFDRHTVVGAQQVALVPTAIIDNDC
jgi:hypothetical protein